MGCISEDDLLEYVDRRLPPERVALTEGHLRDCEACRYVLVELAPQSPERHTADSPLFGRYEVLRPIGAGGMGVVYAARDLKLRRTVAIKMLRTGRTAELTEQKMRARLLREARAMAQLSHPNVLAVYDVGESNGNVFLAMELVEGGTLSHWLRQKKRSWREVLDVLLAAARGLSAAHAAGLIHRDFKPENVLVGEDGRVRVTDFGLASAAAAGSQPPSERRSWDPVLSVSGAALAGSPAYMAPEQMRGEKVDSRADVFSFCVTLHEGMYGERPFAGDSVAEIEAAVLRGEVRDRRRGNRTPPWVRRALLRGLKAAPADRFPSMDAIITVLERGRSLARARAVGVAVALAVTAALAATAGLRWPVMAPSIAALARSGLQRIGPVGLREQQTSVVAPEPGAVPTRIPEAYELYLRAKVLLRRMTEQNNLAGIQMLERAVALDPDFAAAYAEIAVAYSTRVGWYAPDDVTALERADVAQTRALRLNRNLPEAHFAAAQLLAWATPPRFAYERAVREIKHALALNPDYAQAHQMLGTIYEHTGLLDEALAEYRKAVDLDPTSQNPVRMIATTLVARGDYEEAVRTFRQVPPDSNPAAWHYVFAQALQYAGRSEEAWTLMDGYLKVHPDDRGGVVTSTRAIWYARAGNVQRAEADIRTALENSRGYVHSHHTEYAVGSAYALLGRAAPALQWLRAAAEDGWPCYPHFAHDPNLANIRDAPGYVALLSELKMKSERYRASF
jgi:serine/threonine protein kinase/tetratricopeptide (TPR) repeat protein